MKKVIAIILILASVVACEKSDEVKEGDVLDYISGEYYLYNYRWKGISPIDLNNDGTASYNMMLELMAEGALSRPWPRAIIGYQSLNSNTIVNFPVITGSLPQHRNETNCIACFPFVIKKDEVWFFQDQCLIVLPDNNSLTVLEGGEIDLFNSELDSRFKSILVTFSGSLYDYASGQMVGGELQLTYGSAPFVELEDDFIRFSTPDVSVEYYLYDE